jgi:hypothetical protein
VLGADLEAGGVDDAVDLVLPAAATTPVSVMRSTPLPSVSTRKVPGSLKASRYSSWKHGRLHSWRYQAFSRCAVSWSSTTESMRARISSIFSKSESSNASIIRAGVRPLAGRAMIFERIRRERSVQPSMTRSSSVMPPVWLAVKFSSQRCCQPGVAISANHAGSVGWLLRTSTEDGVRWKTYSSLHARARWGTHWTAVAPVPMMATRLSASFSSGAPDGSPPV